MLTPRTFKIFKWYFVRALWLAFVKRRSRGGRSTPTADMSVAERADAEQTGTVTAAGLVRALWYSVAVYPTVSFVHVSTPVGILKGDNMIGGETPGIAFFSQGGPSVMVKVTGIKRFLSSP